MTPTRYVGLHAERAVVKHNDKSRQRFDTSDSDRGGLDNRTLLIIALLLLAVLLGVIHT